jgi:hypothetical protein
MRCSGLWLAAAVVCLACEPTYTPAAVQSLTTPIDEARQPFFSAPWPDDRRLASDGTVPTDNFPNPYGQSTLAENLMQTGDHLVHGWGTSAPAYMPLSGAIDTSSLPAAPKAGNPSVFIVNIDPASPELGQRAVVDFHFYATANSFVQANVLAVRPVPGFPLLAKTKYAVVVTTAVKDANGHAVGPQQPFWDVFVGTPKGSSEEELATYYKPLITELKREHFALTNVAGATIFTTQPIIDEMLTLRDYLLSLPVPAFDPGTLQYDSNLSVPAKGSTPGYYVFEATYPATNMQHGTPPFAQTGGDFEYDANGTPIPGYVEHMRVSVLVPTGPQPAGGWPVAMYSHGTGGDYLSSVQEYEALGPTIAQQGIVVFGIDQILTGPRSGLPASEQAGGCFGMLVDNCFIDPVNAVAGRNNLRQSALDNVTLRRLISNPATIIPAEANATTVAGFTNPVSAPITFNPNKLGFIGHSQGGLTGSIYVALDPVPLGGVISGAGGLLTATVIERQNPQLLPLIEGPLFLSLPAGETLEWYHPALALIQTLAEAVDPINWGRSWITSPPPNGRPKNIFTTSGLLDLDTPTDTAEFLNTAARVPQLLPLAHTAYSYTLAGVPPVTAPLSGNVTSGAQTVTASFHQWPAPERHFVIFDDREARHEWSGFLQSLLNTGVATVPADCSTCTCADGTCSNSESMCDDGTSCALCDVCECFERQGNTCPVSNSGQCSSGYGNCLLCNVCICDDDTCARDQEGDCDDGTSCLVSSVEGPVQ